MATYDNYPPPNQRQQRPPPPYPNGGPQGGYDPRAPRDPPRYQPEGDSRLPPPPMGDALSKEQPPSAMRPDGARGGRVPQHVRPEFPDEGSYLGSNAPDLERKNGRRDRQFRDKRDGYESEEGEMHRNSRNRRGGPPSDASYDDRRRRPRDRDPYDDGYGAPRRRDQYDERDDRGPPQRRRNDSYYDDEPPRRNRGGPRPEIEYGSEPIPMKRRNTERPSRRGRDYYEGSDSEDDHRQRRHRSQEDRQRRRHDQYDDDYDRPRGGPRGARDDYYDQGDRRRDRSRGRFSDDDRDDRRDRGSRRDKPPKEIMVGGKDIGPIIAQGKKHYSMIAPLVTPLVINAARKYLTK